MSESGKSKISKQDDVKYNHRKKEQESQPSFDRSFLKDAGKDSLEETPFYPKISEHAAVLSAIPLSAQRHEFIMRLNNTYGLRYVQRLVESVNAKAKLTVSDPGDIYEQEADRVAEEVTRSINTPLRRQTPDEEEELQMQEEEEELQTIPLLQRQDEEEELQMQTDSVSAAIVTNDIETRINSARGSGQPLSDEVRQPMEQAFGADFSSVRTHTGSEANTLNWELSARAFTTGQDIFFGEGEYNPGSDSGKKLIAHELTHVVQQHADGVSRSNIIQRDTIAENMIVYMEQSSEALEQLAAEFTTLGRPVSSTKLYNALSDPAFDVEGNIALAHELRDEGMDNWHLLLLQNLSKPIETSSCYATAANLFTLIAQGDEVDTGSYAKADNSANALRTTVQALNTAIQNSIDEQNESVFRIEYAGHGFTLVTRPDEDGDWAVEHLESLAHTASLIYNLYQNITYTGDEVTGYLTDMASDNIENRRQGAAGMGWDADMINLGEDPKYGNRIDFPRVNINWWQKALNPSWKVEWVNMIRQRYLQLRAVAEELSGTEPIPLQEGEELEESELELGEEEEEVEEGEEG